MIVFCVQTWVRGCAETNHKTKFTPIMFHAGKGNAVKRWRFRELPPCDLLRSLHYDIRDVDYAEFVRAEWMWTRKPKSFPEDGLSILVFIIGLVLLLVPYAGIMLALVWCFAMLLVVAKDAVRLVRWRYEYESSIARVVRSRRKAK
jgi:hypothetical protein